MDILPVIKGREGTLVRASLPGADEVGVLLQDGNIVGWTFGDWLNDAYLWAGGDSATLKVNISTADFYKITFAGGREELFAMALEGGGSEAQRLNLLVNGYETAPKLSQDDTPYNLLPEAVLPVIKELVAKMLKERREGELLGVLDSRAFKSIGDIDLFMMTLDAIANQRGYQAAVKEIETTGAAIVQAMGVDVPALNERHLGLYQDWLQDTVNNGDIAQGENIYTTVKAYYPDDAYVNLLGVELALLKGDWRQAEKMLYERNYPPEMMDRFDLLARKISDIKAQEGSIVIRFTPGANRVPLTATLNGTLAQNFLVDTGASMVTVPRSVVDDLGLEIIRGDHYGQRTVSTAGGVVGVDEVVLDSVEVGGWVEYNVRALVLDIPDQPGLGLCGLNYLNRFSMDLNNDDGVLVLTPK